MSDSYWFASALQTTVFETLELYGLDASPADINRRRPLPAKAMEWQMRRIMLSVEVVRHVRSKVSVSKSDRDVIWRLVDWGCHRLEEQEAKENKVRASEAPALRARPSRLPQSASPGTIAGKEMNPVRTIRSSRWPAAGASKSERSHE